MRKLLIATAAITAIAAPAAAQSISNTYGTLGYSSVQGNDTDLGAVTGRLGVGCDHGFARGQHRRCGRR